MAKIESSVGHSLRMENTEERRKGLEWDKDKTHRDLVYIPELFGEEKTSLDTFNEQGKRDIQKYILDHVHKLQPRTPEDLQTEIDDLLKKMRKKRSSIKKFAKPYPDLYEKLVPLVDKQNEEFSEDELNECIELIKSSDMKRVNQRVKSIQDYFDLHVQREALKQQRNDKTAINNAVLQETILKLPSTPLGKVSNDFFIEALKNFYSEYYPDYYIKAIFFHGSETYPEKDEKGDLTGEELGAHSHIMVNTRNAKTGKYDLLQAQKKKAIDYILNHPDEFPDINKDLLKPNLILHRRKRKNDVLQPLTSQEARENKEMRRALSRMGEAHQKMIFRFLNKQLKPYRINVQKVVYDTDEKQEKKRNIDRESKLRKSEREFNYLNQKISDLKDEAKSAKEQKRDALKVLEQAEIHTKQLSNYIKMREDSLELREDEIRRLNEDFDQRLKEAQEQLENKYPYYFENAETIDKAVEQVEGMKAMRDVVNRVEKIAADDTHPLKKMHRKAYRASKSYRSAFDWAKGKYYEIYKTIKGEAHKNDPSNKRKSVINFVSDTLKNRQKNKL
ncbi:hypothetical protein [Saccharospirillum salsuginis]|nr:hypothetical protein [Saccharospirillum salsuginis]